MPLDSFIDKKTRITQDPIDQAESRKISFIFNSLQCCNIVSILHLSVDFLIFIVALAAAGAILTT